MIIEIIENVIMWILDEYLINSVLLSLSLSIGYPILKWLGSKIWNKVYEPIEFPSVSFSNLTTGLLASAIWLIFSIGYYAMNYFIINDPTGEWAWLWILVDIEVAFIVFVAPSYHSWKDSIIKPMLTIMSISMIITGLIGVIMPGGVEDIYLLPERALDDFALKVHLIFGILGLLIANFDKTIEFLRK